MTNREAPSAEAGTAAMRENCRFLTAFGMTLAGESGTFARANIVATRDQEQVLRSAQDDKSEEALIIGRGGNRRRCNQRRRKPIFRHLIRNSQMLFGKVGSRALIDRDFFPVSRVAQDTRDDGGVHGVSRAIGLHVAEHAFSKQRQVAD
jgi:hypothetical protein